MKNGKKPDSIAAQARRPAFSAFAVTVHGKARETRAKSALGAKYGASSGLLLVSRMVLF